MDRSEIRSIFFSLGVSLNCVIGDFNRLQFDLGICLVAVIAINRISDFIARYSKLFAIRDFVAIRVLKSTAILIIVIEGDGV